MILFARVATYVEFYVKTFFFLSFNPPPLSNLLKSTCSTCSAFKIFQNIQNCNRHQSAQDAQAPKVFFSRVFTSGFWHSVQTCVRNSLYGFLWPTWLCQIVLYDQGFVVLFFFKLTLLICFKKKQRISDFFSHQCQGHALVSVKMNVAPVHF